MTLADCANTVQQGNTQQLDHIHVARCVFRAHCTDYSVSIFNGNIAILPYKYWIAPRLLQHATRLTRFRLVDVNYFSSISQGMFSDLTSLTVLFVIVTLICMCALNNVPLWFFLDRWYHCRAWRYRLICLPTRRTWRHCLYYDIYTYQCSQFSFSDTYLYVEYTAC